MLKAFVDWLSGLNMLLGKPGAGLIGCMHGPVYVILQVLGVAEYLRVPPSVLLPLAQPHVPDLLAGFGDANMFLEVPKHLQAFCSKVPFLALLWWLEQDGLMVDSENDIVVLITHWWRHRHVTGEKLPGGYEVSSNTLLKKGYASGIKGMHLKERVCILSIFISTILLKLLCLAFDYTSHVRSWLMLHSQPAAHAP